ncbi:DNA-binding HxlR family transcriptional regulator [Streptomyces olivoverticillatus]|uniref:DNA-binding HxlR family transcriptional regulator n=1 Tax=Streptomyces olivoverticillatus TaxID=66427 RepID=A0A7W7PL02_9ACTN|nr:DNA-binding HxlR family transcriptional regulator [Streptomyces olivoverticillatus]
MEEEELCPCRPLLDRLGDRWSALTLSLLGEGPAYFGELERRMSPVSRKVLTQTLRGLERDGLVLRTVEQSPVVRVSYALSELGASLTGPLLAIRRWTDRHQPSVDAARSAYDAARPSPGVTALRERAAAGRATSVA